MNNNSLNLNIDVDAILKSIWRNILIVILTAVISACAGLAYTYFFTVPTYSATVMVYVNNKSVSIGGTGFYLSSGDSVVDTYATLLGSRTTLEEIISVSGVNYSAAQLSRMISASKISNTSFMNITVSCANPADAELLANTIAAVLPNRVTDIVDGSTLRVVDYAVIPSGRASNNLISNALIGAAAGALAVCIFLTVKVIFTPPSEPLIQSADDISEFYPDIPILGTIRDMRNYSKSALSGYYKRASKIYGYDMSKYSDYYSSNNK